LLIFLSFRDDDDVKQDFSFSNFADCNQILEYDPSTW